MAERFGAALTLTLAFAVASTATASAIPPPFGNLTENGCVEQPGAPTPCSTSSDSLASVNSVLASRDGRNVYVTNQNTGAITFFARHIDGTISFAGCVKEAGNAAGGQCAKAFAQSNPSSLAESPDGKQVYVADFNGGVLLTFNRGTDGALTPVQCFADPSSSKLCITVSDGLQGAEEVVASKDGKNVYVVARDSDDVAVFSRASDGKLTPAGCFGAPAACGSHSNGLLGSVHLAIAPDDVHLYVSAGATGARAVTTLARGANGSLSFAGCARDTGGLASCGAATNTVDYLYDPDHLTVAPDGTVYVAVGGNPDNTGDVAILKPGAGGALVPQGCVKSPGSPVTCASTAPFANTGEGGYVAASSDNRNVYVAGQDGLGVFARGANGSLTQTGCAQHPGGSPPCPTPAAGLDGAPLAVTAAPDGRDVYATSYSTVVAFKRELPPVCAAASLRTPFETPTATRLRCTDPNGDPVRVRIVSGPAHGRTGSVSSTGRVVYTPRDLFTGHDAFRFVAGDGRLDSASAQASVTVVRDRTRPRVAILSRRLTVRHGKVAVRLGCPRVERRGCRGRVSVGRIGSSAFRIRGGRRGLVRVRVHSAHAGHVTVKVRAVDRARNVGVTRRRVTLKL